MKNMLKFELKKIFSKSVNRIGILVLIAVTLFGVFMTVRDVTYIKENGETVTGREAASLLSAEKNRWKGELTPEVFRKMVEEGNEAFASSEPEEEAYRKQQSIEDIRELFGSVFGANQEFDYYVINTLAPIEAQEFYEKRESFLQEKIESMGFSEKEKHYVEEKYEEIDTPFYYEAAEGFRALLDDSHYLATLMIAIVVVLGFLVSGIFSDEFALKADAILFSAKLGRSKAILAKVEAGLIVVTVVYWGVILLFSGLVLGILGTGGANCMIQNGANYDSIYKLTYIQEWLLTVCCGYIGTLFVLSLAMFISVKSRSTVMAVTVPFVLSCAPMFVGRISVLARIISLFPDMLLRFHENLRLDETYMYSFGTLTVGSYTILPPLYLLLSVLILPFLYHMYREAEVK